MCWAFICWSWNKFSVIFSPIIIIFIWPRFENMQVFFSIFLTVNCFYYLGGTRCSYFGHIWQTLEDYMMYSCHHHKQLFLDNYGPIICSYYSLYNADVLIYWIVIITHLWLDNSCHLLTNRCEHLYLYYYDCDLTKC